jgi:NitT/TauT family transport system substrate-binding protein
MHALKIACASLCAVALAGACRAAPFEIREAWVAPGNWSSIWLAKKDLARHIGQSYALDPVEYVGTPPMITALANDQIEIANLAYSTLGIAVQNAGLDDMRVVADEFQDGVDDYYSEEYMVLKHGPIQKTEDLKDRIVATNAAGSAVDVAMKAMLHNHGLEPNRDYTVVEAPLPAMKAMLADLIPSVLPFSYDPELRKIARDLFVQKQAIGVSDMLLWCMRQSVIDQHRPALVDFFEDTVRIVHWYLDPANHEAAMDIVGALTKRPPQSFDWLFTKRDVYHDPDMRPNLDALQRNTDLTNDLGFVTSRFDVKAHSYLSLIEEAAQRLK